MAPRDSGTEFPPGPLRPSPPSTIVTVAHRIADEHPRAAQLAYRIRAEAEELRAEPTPRPIGAAPTDDPERALLLFCPEQGGWQTGVYFEGRWLDFATLSIELEPTTSPTCRPIRWTSEPMCGRVVQARGPLQVAVLCGLDVPDTRFANVPPRYNAAPSQELWAIRQNNDTGHRSRDLLKWGLIPYWSKEKPKPPPINAKAETVHKLPMFRDAYAKRRCIMSIDLFFEWKVIKGAKAKQPYAIGMKDGSPFGLAGIWENWKDPSTGEWVRTFAVITTEANELVADIHDRMPVILRPQDYDRWLGIEPDPRDLLRPFPAELMRMWPISTRVNSPKNDDTDLLTPVEPESSTTLTQGPNPA